MLNFTIYTDNQSIINYNLFFQQNNFFIKKVIINNYFLKVFFMTLKNIKFHKTF